MGIKVHNFSAQKLDIWTSLGGPLQWNNNTPAGESTTLDPGWVWVTVNAKVSTEGGGITLGQAIGGNMLGGLAGLSFVFGPLVGAAVLGGILGAQKGGAFRNDVLPEDARKYIDAGAVIVEDGVELKQVEVHGVYGRDNDIDIFGGEVECHVAGGKLVVTKINPLRMHQR